MSEFRSLGFSDLCDKLSEVKNTLICFHVHPDGDAAGSAFALRIILEKIGARAYCVCSDEISDRLRFLMNPYQTSVTYDSIPAGFEVERIITVDTASVRQLGALYDVFGGEIDFMIDHHGRGEAYADCFVMENAAATGEIVFNIAKELCDRKLIDSIPREACERIYAAISSDTGCFKFSNVTPATHMVASELVNCGIDTAKINQLLYGTKPYILLKAEQVGFERLQFFGDGKIAVICFPYTLKESMGLKDEHLETLVDVARMVEGVEVAVAIRQFVPENIFRVSTRSSNDVDVSSVCAAFGGGGHIRAAGCTVEAENIEEAMRLVVSEIEKQM